MHEGTCILGFRLHGARDTLVTELDRGEFRALPWGWNIVTHGTFTVTLFPKKQGAMADGNPRVILFPGTPEFAALEFPRFEAVLFRDQKPVRRYRVDVLGSPVAEFWNTALSNAKAARVPPLSLRLPLAWLTLNAIGTHSRLFGNREHLKVGWATALMNAASAFRAEIAELPQFNPGPATLPVANEVIEMLRRRPDDPAAAASHLYAKLASAPLQEVSPILEEVQNATAAHDGNLVLMGLLHTMGLLSESVTRAGERMAWLSLLPDRPALQFIDIDPAGFTKETCLAYFSRASFSNPPIGTGRFVAGNSVPAPLYYGDPAWDVFPRADDIEQTLAAADALLDEASTSKIGTIPPGAVVQPAFGPFSHFVVHERRDGVWFVAMTKEGEYALMCVEPDTRYLYFPTVTFAGDERIAGIKAALKLFLASVVRDFWVVEEREQVFATRAANNATSTKGLHGVPTGPRIVYLPRIRYVAGEVGRIADMRASINPASRRAHEVASHFRRVDRPSQAQIDLARFLGLAVPPGHTFVRAHNRGNDSAWVIYRSRSALRSLYASAEDLPPGTSEWFSFERAVMKFMQNQGFEVTHHSLARNGDEGVDLRATKGKDLDLVMWAIQCKCYRAGRPVGTDAVRELIGALSAEPSGTRGMLVTSSHFTSGAKELAAQHNIRLLDGPEFAQLSK